MSDVPDQRSRPQTGDGKPVHSPSSADNFRFTFSVSASGSAQSSFIEPDPMEDIYYDDSDMSLTESVQDYPEEFGRTYHAYKAGSYVYPNDRMERDRLDIQSEVLTQTLGGRLFLAPLQASRPRRILDIATGTGAWAIQMGDAFPEAQVIATDLSPIQPNDVPPNVNFFVEDMSEPWEYSQKFDYVHARVTSGCWSDFKTQVADQAFQNLAPGGWFEVQDLDNMFYSDDATLPKDGALARWILDMQVATKACDRPLLSAKTFKMALEAAGFVDIHERVYKIPNNSWPKDERLKELGRSWGHQFTEGLSGFSVLLFNRIFNRTVAELEVNLVDVRREILDPRIHSYVPFHVVWGRKPYPGELRPTSVASI